MLDVAGHYGRPDLFPARGQTGGAGADRLRLTAGGLQSVKGAVLSLHVADPRRGGQRLAGRALHQLVGRGLTAMPVAALAKPSAKRRELAVLPLRGEVPDVGME